VAVMDSGYDVTFFVNGAQTGITTHTASGVANLDDSYLIGASTLIGTSTKSYFFLGEIDDVRIYDYKLSPSEVSAVYSVGAQ
jgi:hypothetical protein